MLEIIHKEPLVTHTEKKWKTGLKEPVTVNYYMGLELQRKTRHLLLPVRRTEMERLS